MRCPPVNLRIERALDAAAQMRETELALAPTMRPILLSPAVSLASSLSKSIARHLAYVPYHAIVTLKSKQVDAGRKW